VQRSNRTGSPARPPARCAPCSRWQHHLLAVPWMACICLRRTWGPPSANCGGSPIAAAALVADLGLARDVARSCRRSCGSPRAREARAGRGGWRRQPRELSEALQRVGGDSGGGGAGGDRLLLDALKLTNAQRLAEIDRLSYELGRPSYQSS
jgi:hypothetical protein